MLLEDPDATVETPVVETPAVEVVAVEAPAVEEPAVETPEIPDAPWNGELRSLDEQDWYASLDDVVHERVRSGLDNVRRNMDRGFHSKTVALSNDRKTLEERERLLTNLMTGDFEGTIEELVAARVAEKSASLETKVETAEAAGDTAEVARLREEIEALRQQYEAVETQNREWLAIATKADQDAVNAEADEAYDFFAAQAPDLVDNDEAFARYQASPDIFEDNALALAFVRLKFPAPAVAAPPAPAPAPVVTPAKEPPKGVIAPPSVKPPETGETPGVYGGFAQLDNELEAARRRVAT